METRTPKVIEYIKISLLQDQAILDDSINDAASEERQGQLEKLWESMNEDEQAEVMDWRADLHWQADGEDSGSGRFRKTGTPFNGFVQVETWDGGLPFPLVVVRASDSVVGLLVDSTNDRVLLVRQHRAAMVRKDNPDGLITELAAGRFDVELGPKALLVKEAREEAGITLSEDDVELVNVGAPMALSAGVLTERTYGGIVFIRPEQIGEGEVGYGVMDEGESISRVWMSIPEFTSPNTQHDDWRVWAMAQFLARRRLEERLAKLTDVDHSFWDYPPL